MFKQFFFVCVQICCVLQFGISKSDVALFNHFSIADFYDKIGIRIFPSNNGTSFKEHPYSTKNIAKILHVEDNYILLGMMDAMLNLSLPNLQENSKYRILTNSLDSDISKCKKYYHYPYCNNYINFLAPLENSPFSFILCGTNSYFPKCHYYYYKDNNFGYTRGGEIHFNVAIVPMSPLEIFSNLVSKTNRIFSIISSLTWATSEISMTKQAHEKTSFLIDPSKYFSLTQNETLIVDNSAYVVTNKHVYFNKILEFKGHLFMFLQESVNKRDLAEANLESSCLSDKYFYTHSKTILKWKLICGSQNDIYLKDVSSITTNELENCSNNKDNSNIVYTLFGNSALSTICLYDINLIYNNNKDNDNYFEGILANFEDEDYISFSKNYTMEKVVVDLQSRRLNPSIGKFYDVIFVSTSRGTVLKIIISGSIFDHLNKVDIKARIAEEINPFNSAVNEESKRIWDLKFQTSKINKTRRLLITYNLDIIIYLLPPCNQKADSCDQCLKLRDPYCAWNKIENECQDIFSPCKLLDKNIFLQNLEYNNDNMKFYQNLCRKPQFEHVLLKATTNKEDTFSEIVTRKINFFPNNEQTTKRTTISDFENSPENNNNLLKTTIIPTSKTIAKTNKEKKNAAEVQNSTVEKFEPTQTFNNLVGNGDEDDKILNPLLFFLHILLCVMVVKLLTNSLIELN